MADESRLNAGDKALSASSPFHDFVTELLAGLGPVSIRRMFGGAGVYADAVMFALIDEDTLYIKADDALKAELGAAGSTPFIYIPGHGSRAGEPVDMGYWRLPEEALDEPELAVEWARKALGVARAKAAAKPKKKTKG